MLATPATHPPKTCIIGAGISGLAHAWALKNRGGRCTVLEQAKQPGGALHSYRASDYLAEEGPHSIQINSIQLENFLTSIPDLQTSIIESKPEAKKRFIVRNGKLYEVPLSPLAAITTRLWSLKGKLRALKEPFVKAATDEIEESIATFTRRRLGKELYEYGINPLVAGIYAGNPEMLSLQHTFPKLHALEKTHGGLVRGMIHSMRMARKSKAQQPSKRILSFAKGMGELPEKLAQALNDSIYNRVAIHSIQRHDARWSVKWSTSQGSMQEDTFDQLILTVPAHQLSALPVQPELQIALRQLDSIDYPPVSVLTLGFRRKDVKHPLDGFGFLVPERENRQILGVLFPSSIFPKRAPKDEVLLAAFVGGARQPSHASADTEKLKNHVLPELEALLGVTGQPTFQHHRYWEKAIPQYTLGYSKHLTVMQQIEEDYPGLKLAGNYRTGVSVTACIEAALIS